LLVSPKLSVSEGHHISEAVEKILIEKFDEVNDVTVHIDSEDDEAAASCKHLPMRNELLLELSKQWPDGSILNNIENITLHYLDGYIIIEAQLPLSNLKLLEDAEIIKQEFNHACKQIACVGDSQLHFI
jgi:hypothetical protein